MKKILVLLTIALSYCNATQAVCKIELFNVIRLFTPNKTMDYNIYEWNTGTSPNSPIKWTTAGVEINNNTVSRRGLANISVSGKTYQCLGQYNTPCDWNIILYGCRNGYTRFSIYSVNHHEIAPAIPITKILGNKKCTTKLIKKIEDKQLYELTIPHKKKIWLVYSWSCGSAGCSINIDCFTNYSEMIENIII